ncbi:winged helix-turn-helix transcriptional regulator [Candidatus Bathyarchaeota archaeon]|nr:winged helix-turn-helix transcriptional regulator [Candidatus Bathyarchaeota archaeon]
MRDETSQAQNLITVPKSAKTSETEKYSLAEFFSLHTNTLIKELYSLYSDEKKSGFVDARCFRKFIRLLNLIDRPQSRDIIGFLIKNGATTSLELEVETGLPQGTISRNLKALTSLGFVKRPKRARVGSPFKPESDRGPKVKIYALSDASPQAAIEAQMRYATLTNKQVEDVGRQSDLEEWGDPAVRAALYSKAKEAGITVERFSDIYTFVDSTGIPDDEKLDAKHWLRDKLIDEAVDRKKKET